MATRRNGNGNGNGPKPVSDEEVVPLNPPPVREELFPAPVRVVPVMGTGSWLGVLCIVLALLLIGGLVALVVFLGPIHRESAPQEVGVVSNGYSNAEARPAKVVTQGKGVAPAKNTPATCPHNGTPALLTGSCNGAPRASLVLDNVNCPTNITAGLTCNEVSRWTLDKVAEPGFNIIPIDPFTYMGVFFNPDAFTINVTKTTSLGFTGHGELVILNTGSCETSRITSVLFLLEQNAGGGTGDSYGPGWQNHKLWATSGSENPVIDANCNSPDSAFICDSVNNALQCKESVPYEPNSLFVQPGNTPLNLADYVLAPNANCQTALRLNLSVTFDISPETFDAMQADLTGYRISVLVTFDACCDRGSACGINVDCSNDNSKEVVRTVQVRSPSFALNTTCNSFCDCVALSDQLLDDEFNLGTCLASATRGFVDLEICEGGLFDVSLTANCDATDCECDQPLGVNVVNQALVAAPEDSPEGYCNDPLTGELLFDPSDTASKTFFCGDPPVQNCTVTEWSAWTPVDPEDGICATDSTDPCSISYTRTREVLTEECHGGVCFPLVENRTDACSTEPNECIGAPNQTVTLCSPQTCTRDITDCITYPLDNVCDDGDLIPCVDSCETHPEDCSLPCEIECGEWSEWSACADNCSSSRERTCTRESPCPPFNGCLPGFVETQNRPCERPCQSGFPEATPFGPCTFNVTLGNCTHTQFLIFNETVHACPVPEVSECDFVFPITEPCPCPPVPSPTTGGGGEPPSTGGGGGPSPGGGGGGPPGGGGGSPAPTPTAAIPTPVAAPVPTPQPPPPPPVCTYTPGGYGNCDGNGSPPQCDLLENLGATSIGTPTRFNGVLLTDATIVGSCSFATGLDIANFLPQGGTAKRINSNGDSVNCPAGSVLQSHTLTALLNAFGNGSSPLICFDFDNCPLENRTSVSPDVNALLGIDGISIQDIVVAASVANTKCNGDATALCNCDAMLTVDGETACDTLGLLTPAQLTAFLSLYNTAFDDCLPGAQAGCFALCEIA